VHSRPENNRSGDFVHWSVLLFSAVSRRYFVEYFTAQFLPFDERNNDALTKIAAMLLSMYITANIEECVERRENESALEDMRAPQPRT
jgi:hypothetical protein